MQSATAQSILRDAETERASRRYAANPLVSAAGLDPRNVDVVMINDPSLNAFVAGGTGRLPPFRPDRNEAGSANEVQGVIAHELGHITGGHVISDGGKAATGISISPRLGVARRRQVPGTRRWAH